MTEAKSLIVAKHEDHLIITKASPLTHLLFAVMRCFINCTCKQVSKLRQRSVIHKRILFHFFRSTGKVF